MTQSIFSVHAGTISPFPSRECVYIPEGRCKKDKVRLTSEASNTRTRGNGHEEVYKGLFSEHQEALPYCMGNGALAQATQKLQNLLGGLQKLPRHGPGHLAGIGPANPWAGVRWNNL